MNWDAYTEADFRVDRAPKYVRDNAAAGMVPLFATGAPTVARPEAEQLDGQEDLFNGEDQQS
jgi:hypothetical protein